MHQITWFWPPKLKNLPTPSHNLPPLGRFAPSGLIGRSAPSHLFSKLFSVCFLMSEITPPPHFWRPVYATEFNQKSLSLFNQLMQSLSLTQGPGNDFFTGGAEII